jgi:hypothetical protein
MAGMTRELHMLLNAASKGKPVIAFELGYWKSEAGKILKEHVPDGTYNAQVLRGITAEGSFDTTATTIEIAQEAGPDGFKTATISNLVLWLTLRTINVGAGFLSQHKVTVNSLKCTLDAREGRLCFIPSGTPDYIADIPTPGPDRQIHLDTLLQDFGYSNKQLQYFTTIQEPGAGLVFVNGVLESMVAEIPLIDLSTILPGFKFFGDFAVSLVTTPGGDAAIAVVPEILTRCRTDDCTAKQIESSTHTSGDFDRLEIDGKVKVKTNESVREQLDRWTRSPPSDGKAEVFVHLPDSLLKELANPSDTFKQQIGGSVSSGGSGRFPPLYFDWKLAVRVLELLRLTVDQRIPVANFEARLDLYGRFDVDLKVGKLRTPLFDCELSAAEIVRYNGTVIDVDGMIGQLTDPELDVKLVLDTPAPGIVDKAVSWLATAVLGAVLRWIVKVLLTPVRVPLLVSSGLFSDVFGQSLVRVASYCGVDNHMTLGYRKTGD